MLGGSQEIGLTVSRRPTKTYVTFSGEVTFSLFRLTVNNDSIDRCELKNDLTPHPRADDHIIFSRSTIVAILKKKKRKNRI